MLRAIRFTAALGYTIAPETLAAIRRLVPSVRRISAERIREELNRIFTSGGAREGMELLAESGLLEQILPEVLALHGVRQPPEFHPEGDVWRHTLMMLDALPVPREASLAYATLLHDIGKPLTTVTVPAANGGTRIRSPNHAAVGAKLARQVLERLRLPNRLIDDVESMVRRHMTFAELPNMRQATLRRFMGTPTFSRELELHRIDTACSSGDDSILRFASEQKAALDAEPVLPPPWVRGRDLLELGLKPGPKVGRWVTRAYDLQLEGAARDRDALLQLLREQIRRHTPSGSNKPQA